LLSIDFIGQAVSGAPEHGEWNMDVYQHVRIVMSILVGLSVTHLLRGAAGLVEHPRRTRVYWVHLVWVLFIFLYLVHFWWWEFRLTKIPTWTFPLYFFVIFYGVLLYLLCALLFPEDLTDYDGFKSYFYSRRRWFFGVLAAMFVIDIWDTIVKGRTYVHMLGFEYDVRTFAFIACSLIAIKTKNEYFHAAFALIGTLYEVSFIIRLYYRLGAPG
jgi:hypothetical protein